MQRPASTGALLRLRDDGTPRRNEVEIVMDPLFDDINLRGDDSLNGSGKGKEKEPDALFFSPMSTSQYTFTWRGCKSRAFSENRVGSVALCVLSGILLVMYYLSRDNVIIHPHETFFFNTFAIHYSIAVFMGFVICIFFFLYQQKLLPESGVLFACVLFSHYPDILAVANGLPHDFWMNIFFLHPFVELWYSYAWVPISLCDGVVIYLYVKMIEESRPKTSARNLVALL